MDNIVNIKFHDFPGKSFAEGKRRNIKVVCDGKTFPLHKAVLSATSQYFSNLFRQQVECPQRVIHLKGMKCSQFEILLKYMYEGEVFVKQSEIGRFMEAAEFLQMTGIADVPLSARLLAKKQKKIQLRKNKRCNKKSTKSMKLQFTKRIGLTPFNDDGFDSDDSFQGFSEANGECIFKSEFDDCPELAMDIKEEALPRGTDVTYPDDELLEPWGTGEQEFIECEMCSFRTTIRSNLHRHNLSHMPVPTLTCKVCSYETTQPAQFQRHSLKHLNDKNLKCHLCKYKALNSQLLSTHVRTHTGYQPYVCKVGSCSYKDAQAKTFYEHMTAHKLPHVCIICSYRSASGEAMTLHMATHVPEKSYKCNVCPYVAQKVEYIRRHALSHRTKKQSSSIPITIF